MPNPFRHRVNYCLQEARRVLAKGEGSGHAAEETAVFFLWRAYRLYLRELAHQLNLKDAAFVGADALAQALAAKGSCSEAVAELQALEQQGWAHELCRQWQECLEPVIARPEGKPGVIMSDHAMTVQLPEKPAVLLAELEALLDRQRMVGEEW